MRHDYESYEFDGETSGTRAPAGRRIEARILWPALGFPAVIVPRTGGAQHATDSDATRTICVLLLSNTPSLTPQDVARYLRCVPWADRHRKTVATGGPESFPASAIFVQNGLVERGPGDKHGQALTFGANRQHLNGVTVSLSRYVRGFYAQKTVGLRYLHEIRLSEHATAGLSGDQFHLFWNTEAAGPVAHSQEVELLLNRFVPQRLAHLKPGSGTREFLLKNYQHEYGAMHAPYNALGPAAPAEIFHPVFLWRQPKAMIGIGHVTDVHVDVRNDIYARNLQDKAGEVHQATRGVSVHFNNWNDSFQSVYGNATSPSASDVILLTGDLIDYGRGHIGDGLAGKHLGRDDQYVLDMNWILFSYLLASGNKYRRPVYTILGNHDWRVNPYPPFAPGAPSPEELIHNSSDFTGPTRSDVLKKVIQIAHGDGHDRELAYFPLARDVVEIMRTAWKGKSLIPSALFGVGANLDHKKLPTHTTVESIAWYLLTINPFLDYQFPLATGHRFLMLDFAEQEEVKNSEDGHGQGPRALDCLTPLQQWHVELLTKAPGQAKSLAMHVPPIGPRPEWSVSELQAGSKTYGFNMRPRYKDSNWDWKFIDKIPLPLFGIVPESFSKWLAATYGSFVGRNTRQWLIEKLTGSQSVRLVFSGHIHRQGLLTVQRRMWPLPSEGPGKPRRTARILAVRGVTSQAVSGAKAPLATGTSSRIPLPAPLYVNTTSGGPRGYQYFDDGAYSSVAPGYSLVHLNNDGTIVGVQNRYIAPAATTARKRAGGRP